MEGRWSVSWSQPVRSVFVTGEAGLDHLEVVGRHCRWSVVTTAGHYVHLVARPAYSPLAAAFKVAKLES